jgi:predicted ferric reductase
MVYFFHRQISLVSFALVVAHPILLFIFDPSSLGLLNLITAPWRARAAVSSVVALIVLVAISVYRKKLRIEYNRWRIWHGLLATAVVTLAFVHITLVGHYTDIPAKRFLWGGYCLFFVGMLAWVRVIKPFILLRKPYRVASVVEQPGQSWSVRLVPDGHAGFAFQPGQFAWITVWNSPFSDAEHPFSISSSAEKRGEIEFTIKEAGDFTRRIKHLNSGEVVYVDGPYGSFSIDRHKHARGFIFIAGGIGITPILSMLRTMKDRSDLRRTVLFYANKTLDMAAFRDEINEITTVLNLTVVEVPEKAPQDWTGESGFITQEVLGRYIPAARERDAYEAFICGSKPMMDAVEGALSRLGFFSGDYHSERFDLV